MYNIVYNEHISSKVILDINRIPNNLFLSNNNSFFTSSEPSYVTHSYIKTLYLKNDSDFIPIINVMGKTENSGKVIGRETFEDNIRKRIEYLKGTPSKDMDIDDVLEELYKRVNNLGLNSVSSNIILSANNAYYSNSFKKSFFIKKLLSNNTGSIIITDDGKSLIYPMYYVYDSKIIFTMVVKKDKIIEFKEDFATNKINPSNVEIWIDKEFLRKKDRKMFHKQLREILPMKLTMQGFNIKEKNDIISELTYVPKFKFKSPMEITNFKNNMNKFLLS